MKARQTPLYSHREKELFTGSTDLRAVPTSVRFPPKGRISLGFRIRNQLLSCNRRADLLQFALPSRNTTSSTRNSFWCM